MATAKNDKPAPRQGANNRGGDDRYPIPPPPPPSNPTNDNSQVGFLIAFLSFVVVFGLLLFSIFRLCLEQSITISTYLLSVMAVFL